MTPPGAVAKTRVLISSTSYPRSEEDWQGVFIRHICSALAADPALRVSLWAPPGPLAPTTDYLADPADQSFLLKLAEEGGIAHILRQKPVRATLAGASLLRRLDRVYRNNLASTDIFHVNWLQNALPLMRYQKPVVISVLGTDFKLLKLPGMKTLLKSLFRSTRCILAPNSDWMVRPLKRHFEDYCGVTAVRFGIGDQWYDLERHPSKQIAKWVVVQRLTKDKIGPLFEWGAEVFDSFERELHLIGPNQDNLKIPKWAHFHGPASADAIAKDWFSDATGLISLSSHSEGKPQVMLEAMAAGLPIVASNTQAHASFLEDGVHGKLVSTAAEFKTAVEDVSEHQSTYSENCRQAARDEYGTWSDCASRYRALYQELL